MNTITETKQTPNDVAETREHEVSAGYKRVNSEQELKCVVDHLVKQKMKQIAEEVECNMSIWSDQAEAITVMITESCYTEEVQLKCVFAMASCLAQEIRNTQCLKGLE